MFQEENAQVEIVNNEYDFSNVVPIVENILPLVQYLNSVYNEFIKKCEEDEIKNERFKREYKNYLYSKGYSTKFDISIRGGESFQTTNCPDYNAFVGMVQTNQIINIKSLKIILTLDYKRGNPNNFDEHENKFEIVFEPYKIIFKRKANHHENEMATIEQNIYNFLANAEVRNTIFCTK